MAKATEVMCRVRHSVRGQEISLEKGNTMIGMDGLQGTRTWDQCEKRQKWDRRWAYRKWQLKWGPVWGLLWKPYGREVS